MCEIQGPKNMVNLHCMFYCVSEPGELGGTPSTIGLWLMKHCFNKQLLLCLHDKG